MVPRLLERYRAEIIPAIQEEFGIKNAMAVPCLQKIVINMGVGEAIQDIKVLETAMQDLASLAGQAAEEHMNRRTLLRQQQIARPI